jgi:hypothetical protein
MPHYGATVKVSLAARVYSHRVLLRLALAAGGATQAGTMPVVACSPTAPSPTRRYYLVTGPGVPQAQADSGPASECQPECYYFFL